MIEGKGHRIDPREILTVEQVLLARQSPALTAEVRGKRADYRVENGDRRYLDLSADLLQQLAKCVTDQGEKNDTLVRLDAGDHSLDLAARAHHAPDMFHRVGVIELYEASPSHRVHGFSRG